MQRLNSIKINKDELIQYVDLIKSAPLEKFAV